MRLRQETRHQFGWLTILWIWIAFFAVFQGSQVHAAKGISRNELIGFTQWLQALDVPAASDALYPYGQTPTTAGIQDLDRRLTAARALLTFEESMGRAWDGSEYAREDQCLNNARANREILDFRQAMRWYRTSLEARGGGVPDGHLAREMLATAIMTGDSLQVLEELLNMVGQPRLSERADAVVLAYRHYLYERDESNLGLLMEKVGAQIESVPAEIRYWHAFSLAYLGRNAEALPLLETLARDPQTAERLNREQVAWFVRALPDNLYIQGRHHDALRLYRLLAVREDLDAGRWARFQIANDLLLAGLYDEAEPLLKEACDVPEPNAWQVRACELARTVAAMNDIRKEGMRYGTDGLHVR
jgi:tetratricopeptide (TPR) repeat protein